MKLWLFACICLAILKSSQHDRIKNLFRLPTNVVPEHYKLKINTSLEEDKFQHNSEVEIRIRCLEATNRITLHTRKLSLSEIDLVRTDNNKKIDTKSTFEEEYDFMHLSTQEALEVNKKYVLRISFYGEIKSGSSGYYRSSYRDENGRKNWIAITHFEPTHARAAFPCFDEPHLKAVFSIELTHDEGLSALSNMPMKTKNCDKAEENTWCTDIFEDTPLISTYLVAYVILDFDHETDTIKNEHGIVDLRIWAPKQTLKQVAYAKKITPKIFFFFETYYKISYDLPKCDLIVVPDFAMGAMENWGLIIIREDKLLYVPDKSTENDKYAIAEVIAREVAHYWFGNLVTIKWWTDRWINEGLATYLAMIAMDHLSENKLPKINMYLDNLNAVYDIDGLKNSRPVSVPIISPEKIIEIYDPITYSKVACIIHMMAEFAGVDRMKKGITRYINKHKYSVIDKDDLWNSLFEDPDKKDDGNLTVVSTIMDSWTQQAGFPLVTVTKDYTNEEIYLKAKYTVSQHRYLENTKSNDESCYWVPLTYVGKGAAAKFAWLPCPKKELIIYYPNKNWILFNIEASGLYRVNYDVKNWDRLIHQLHNNHHKIKPLSRVILIEDVVELAMTGHVAFEIAFKLLDYIKNDQNCVTWKQALMKLNRIHDFLYDSPQDKLLKIYIAKLVVPKYERLGDLIKSKQTFTDLHWLLIKTACSIGYQRCINDMTDIFQKWKESDGKENLPESIGQIVICEGLKQGDKDDWNFVWERFQKSKEEKNMLLSSLGCVKEMTVLHRYLVKIVQEDSGIGPQDALKVFTSVIQNPEGSKMARYFFYSHTKVLYNIMSPPGSQMRYYLELVAKSCKSEADHRKYKEFVRRKEQEKYFHMANLTVEQTLEKIVVWQNWREVIYPNISRVLEEIVGKDWRWAGVEVRFRNGTHWWRIPSNVNVSVGNVEVWRLGDGGGPAKAAWGNASGGGGRWRKGPSPPYYWRFDPPDRRSAAMGAKK